MEMRFQFMRGVIGEVRQQDKLSPSEKRLIGFAIQSSARALDRLRKRLSSQQSLDPPARSWGSQPLHCRKGRPLTASKIERFGLVRLRHPLVQKKRTCSNAWKGD
uniref:Uncharacterized protein n=1 Tax=Chromera velia CCMP2878 TaxID=1169474 RepID=A0A0G4HDS9_9ALVE|mmetsp:Transcript_48449/g.95590  ORF Transcript_48449/g.95590 Transcript_48449/m.95590 type:complete len:105 (+) Transcript_48449:230-544(+)|eukprot:Cvel_6404.t1-p1 / transcript=Cvel_6404.t1 / gene=Cvel_6404 / organism=Chromera_velia_CCMP2878 / gene_product=hypothetical protein / transcript_product=hypothetical protein / location=Cvel_scaffold313:17324-21064(+) / protein_length=104 / sequence_SO=supercontig / SO=protein_coding / is_pseudo=false